MENRLLRMFRNSARVGFITLCVVEVLAWAKILHIELEFTWRGLVGTVAIVFLFLEIISWLLRKKGSTSLHPWIYWFAFVVVLFDALGDMMRWYGTYAWYDQVLHLIGGSAVAFVFFGIFSKTVRQEIADVQAWVVYLLSFGMASFGAVLYEAEEYFEDVLTGSNRLGSGRDTANDLVLDVLGAIVLLCIIYCVKRFRRHEPYQGSR